MKKITYKQTEIGEIPRDWKLSSVNSFVELNKNSYSPNGEDNLPYIGLEHINQEALSLNGIGSTSEVVSNKYHFNKGDVLFGKLRPYFRKVYKPNFEGVCSTDIWVLRPKSKNNADFLFYFVANWDFVNFASSGSTGTKMPRANWDQIKNSEWTIPDVDEQQQIASILTSLDDKIELNRKTNKTLEEIGKALFKRWFVDFEFPNENNKPYKSSGGEVVDSGLGKIPKGWRVGTIKDIATVKSGFAFKGSTFNDFGEYGVIKIKNILDPDVDISDMQYVSSEEVTEGASQFVLKSGDILIAMSGNTTGKIGILVKDINELVLNQRAGKYFIKDEKYHWFLYYLLRSGDVQKGIIEKAYGSAQPNISPSILEGISMLMPGEHLVKTFQDICNPLMGKYISNQIQIYKLSRIRDSLLPRLMSGRLRV